jgi:hypothetical protein
MANYGLGLGAFTQGFAGGLGLGQKFQDAQRRNDDRAAIDKINSDARTAFDSDVAAGKATADQWNDRFNSVVLPQVQQEYIRRGDLAGAREASELAQTEISKQGRSLFGHAMTAATAGDMDGALDGLLWAPERLLAQMESRLDMPLTIEMGREKRTQPHSKTPKPS